MHVSTAWTDVLSQGRNGEPTSHPLMNVQLKNLFLLCQSHRRFAWHILCMYFWSFVSFLGRHCAVFSYSTPVKLCEWHISLGIPTFCAIILMVTCWLSTTIWWTSATFSSVVTACEGTGHSSSLGLSLPCLISATHSCVWWYITLQSLHHILMNILTRYPPFWDVQVHGCVLNSLHLWINHHVVYCRSWRKEKIVWKTETQLEIKTKVQPNYMTPL